MSQSLCKSAPWSAPRFRVAGLGSSLLLALGLSASCGPGAGGNVAPQSAANQQKAGAPVRVRSFSDSLPVSTLASASGVLWVGTPHGLVRWSAPNAGAKDAQPTPSVLTTADGLPSDRITSLSIDGKGGVWVLTPKGVSTFADGGWTNFPSPPVGDLVVRGGAGLAAVAIGGTLAIRALDELPLCAALAAAAHGQTVISGAAELRVKESDRIAATCALLRSFGVACEERPDGLVVEGRGPGALRPARVESFGDHRIAMAGATLALAAGGESVIEDVGNVATSFPSFASSLQSLGAELRLG